MKWKRHGPGWYEAHDDEGVKWEVRLEPKYNTHMRQTSSLPVEVADKYPWWNEVGPASTNRDAIAMWNTSPWRQRDYKKPIPRYNKLLFFARKNGVRLDWEGNEVQVEAGRYPYDRSSNVFQRLTDAKTFCEKHATLKRGGRGTTNKPCPGCQLRNTGRPVDGVCDTCQSAIDGTKLGSDQLWSEYRRGVEDGKKGLLMLNSGQLTMSDFDNRNSF